MAKKVEIVIAEQPDGSVAPTSGKKTLVTTGQAVIFQAEPGATDGMVRFAGKSPFAENVIPYRKEIQVTAKFNKKGGAANTYDYDCELVKNGKAVKSKGGGQFEIGSSDN
jgi:hypothetical protein